MFYKCLDVLKGLLDCSCSIFDLTKRTVFRDTFLTWTKRLDLDISISTTIIL